MAGLTENHQIYANLMDEVRIRIHALRDVLLNKDAWTPRILQEFSYLQLRMLCEQIALGCLIAHADIKNKSTLKDWNVPRIIKGIETLNPSFYPLGIRLMRTKDGIHLD